MPAGTPISNTARVNFEVAGVGRSVASNNVVIRAAERLDLTLALTRATTIEAGAAAIVPVTLTNTGNGNEAFLVTGALAPGGTAVGAIAIDVDGDGRFGTGDTPLQNGRTPVLAPGQSLALLLIADIATGSEAVAVTAIAATGAGDPGTTFAAQGDNGSDAVVGATHARASVSVPLLGAESPRVVLEKRQAVSAPDGSANPVQGATITYTMLARFDGAVRGAVIEDPVPVGTRFVPGSMRLDDAVLTDAADTDAGQLAAGQVRIALGDIAAPVTRTVSFQVIIQ